jgi:hypothetical protein
MDMASPQLVEAVSALKHLIVRWYLKELSDEQFRQERSRLLSAAEACCTAPCLKQIFR